MWRTYGTLFFFLGARFYQSVVPNGTISARQGEQLKNRAEGAKHYSPTQSERSERHVGCAFPTPPRRAEGAKE